MILKQESWSALTKNMLSNRSDDLGVVHRPRAASTAAFSSRMFVWKTISSYAFENFQFQRPIGRDTARAWKACGMCSLRTETGLDWALIYLTQPGPVNKDPYEAVIQPPASH